MLLVFASVNNICPGCGLDLGGGTPNETESYADKRPPVVEENVLDASSATSSDEAKSNYKNESDFDKSPHANPEATSFDLLSLLFSYRGRVSRPLFVSTFLLTYSLSLFAREVLARGVQGDDQGILNFWVVLFLVWFTTAISAKRLHACNCSGWWQLAHLIPGIGTLCLAILLLYFPGGRNENRFGAHLIWP